MSRTKRQKEEITEADYKGYYQYKTYTTKIGKLHKQLKENICKLKESQILFKIEYYKKQRELYRKFYSKVEYYNKHPERL